MLATVVMNVNLVMRLCVVALLTEPLAMWEKLSLCVMVLGLRLSAPLVSVLELHGEVPTCPL